VIDKGEEVCEICGQKEEEEGRKEVEIGEFIYRNDIH